MVSEEKYGMRQEWVYGSLSRQGDAGQARYAVINRHGGSSFSPFASLNVGLHVGDTMEIVLQNRKVVQHKLGLGSLLFMRQTHGTDMLVIGAENLVDYVDDLGDDQGCDALLTNIPAVGLAVQHADCQAVLLYDYRHAAIAAVHCGWRGSVRNILAVTVSRMSAEYATDPAEVRAFIGPGLGSCCAEFVNYKQELPQYFYRYMVRSNHFDFHAISGMQLVTAGLKQENIKSLAVCTSCSADYFSYRRACRQGRGQTGRNCTIIWLEKVK